MHLLAHLVRQFSYDDWANCEVLRALQALATPPPKAVRLLAHVVGTEFVWLARLNGEADPAVWPAWGLEEIAVQQQEIARRLTDYLRSLDPEALRREVEYKNTKGELWKNSAADILTHVAMHSAYHRGQIAIVMRDAEITPAYTDYIQAVRTGRIAE